MSNTPETDAVLDRLVKNQAGNSCDAVVIHHARKLERERDEAQVAIRALAEHGESEIQRITKERDKYKQERDEAREALRKAIRFVEAYEPHSLGVEADQNETLSIIRKALEEVK